LAEPEEEEDLGTDQKIRRSVLRTLTDGILLVVALGVIGGWVYTGFYRLELGEEAVIFTLGEHTRTVKREGLNWHWPEPIEYDIPINTRGQRTAEFGTSKGGRIQQDREPAHEGEERQGLYIQTSDKNIVAATFEVQYTLGDPFSYQFGMVDPEAILGVAAQASVREVLGSMLIDDVLLKRRQEAQIQSVKLLERTLATYLAGQSDTSAFKIDKINFLEVHPPGAVRAAFKEVEAARQDEERAVSAALGDEREILERARARATELHEGSEAYKEAKVLESAGESARFESLLTEYVRAPEVTRRRLYLETMEEIMPNVQKMVVEPDTVSIMPLLSIPGSPPPVSAPAPPKSEEAQR
jgi:membrane protease subunit HflK